MASTASTNAVLNADPFVPGSDFCVQRIADTAEDLWGTGTSCDPTHSATCRRAKRAQDAFWRKGVERCLAQPGTIPVFGGKPGFADFGPVCSKVIPNANNEAFRLKARAIAGWPTDVVTPPQPGM